MLKLLNKLESSRDGNFSVLFALSSFALAGVASIALTVAAMMHEKSELQDNLDASVLAGMSLGYSATDNQRIEAARMMMQQRTLKFGKEQQDSHSVNMGSARFLSANGQLVGEATTNVSGMIGNFLGKESTRLKVQSTAEKGWSDPVCLHALNPKLEGSIQLYGTAELDANCVVMADSNDKSGIMTWGKTTFAKAKMFGVTGSYKGTFTPKPVTDVFPLKDQYADLQVPRDGPCMDVASKLMKVEVELEPGTYCGGLSISPQSTVTLRAGTYVFKDGPLNISANSTLKGREVTLALVGENAIINANSNSTIDLTSPTSGEYANIQFISDRELNGSWKSEEWTTLSSTNLTFDGLMYLPEQDIWMKGSSIVDGKSPTMVLVADQIWVQDNSALKVTQVNTRNIDIGNRGSGFRHSARLIK